MIIVTGFFRSGTSALCRMLSYQGINFGRTIPGKRYNPTGYYEDRILNEINQIAGHAFHVEHPVIKERWVDYLEDYLLNRKVDAIKDPRICRLIPVYADIVDDPLFILISRNEDKTVASFDKFTLNYYGEDHARELRQQYYDMARKDLQGLNHLETTYEALMDDWKAVARKISAKYPLEIGEESGLCQK